MLVDSDVLIDVLEDDPNWADWSIAQLQAQSRVHRLAINPIIYAELSLTFSTVEALDRVLGDFFIGAHAAVRGLRVLTRDPRRYRDCFPGVRLVAPE
jgi:predicted nucleic acid-binding protein